MTERRKPGTTRIGQLERTAGLCARHGPGPSLTGLFKGPGAAECPFLPPNQQYCPNTWLGFPPPPILLIEGGGFKPQFANVLTLNSQVADHIGPLEQQAGPPALRVPLSLHNWKVGKCEWVSKSKVIQKAQRCGQTEVCWDKPFFGRRVLSWLEHRSDRQGYRFYPQSGHLQESTVDA